MRFSSFKAGQTKHAICLSFRYCVLHTCDSAIASLQGVSKANEEANQIQAQSKISINCHCEQSEAIHNIESHFLVFRHCEARSNEAIHNQTYFKDSIAKTKGEISDDRLPRDSNESLAMTQSRQTCHCEQSEAIYNQTYFKDSIAKTSLCNIMDCHENQRFSRNDAEASILESCKHTGQRLRNES